MLERKRVAFALVTAQVAGDDLMTAAVVDGEITMGNVASVTGTLVACCGNLVMLLAKEWGCSPEEAWMRYVELDLSLMERRTDG